MQNDYKYSGRLYVRCFQNFCMMVKQDGGEDKAMQTTHKYYKFYTNDISTTEIKFSKLEHSY